MYLLADRVESVRKYTKRKYAKKSPNANSHKRGTLFANWELMVFLVNVRKTRAAMEKFLIRYWICPFFIHEGILSLPGRQE